MKIREKPKFPPNRIQYENWVPPSCPKCKSDLAVKSGLLATLGIVLSKTTCINPDCENYGE